MNIQIFGRPKSFETKKAERYFKERGVRVQSVDLSKRSMSRGELERVRAAVGGGWEALVDERAEGAELVRYLSHEEDKLAKLLENPSMLKVPIVRNGRQATIGYQPKVWETWT